VKSLRRGLTGFVENPVVSDRSVARSLKMMIFFIRPSG